jgi:hypothetical protein
MALLTSSMVGGSAGAWGGCGRNPSGQAPVAAAASGAGAEMAGMTRREVLWPQTQSSTTAQ